MPADLGLFTLACPPRCAAGWMLAAAARAGLTVAGAESVHGPHGPDDAGKLRVTAVRRPDRWLASFYDDGYFGLTGVPGIDALIGWADDEEDDEILLTDDTVDFETLIWRYLDHGRGSIGRAFAAYGGEVVLRVEDLPWALVELLESLDVPRPAACSIVGLPPVNRSPELPPWPDGLRQRVLDAEIEFCERYNYW